VLTITNPINKMDKKAKTGELALTSSTALSILYGESILQT